MGSKRKKPTDESRGGPWPAKLRLAVVRDHVKKGRKAKEVAKVYGIPVNTVYTWALQYKKRGEEAFATIRSGKRKHKSDPASEKLSQEILDTKKQFSFFGVRRVTQWMRRHKLLPVKESQVERTLKEKGLVKKPKRRKQRAKVQRRFERTEPNSLWQVDITMFTIAKGQRAYLIGFIDDYSRYIVGWGLFSAQGTSQVMEVFRNAIAQYGRPKEILSDQGRQFYAWRGKCLFQKELRREGIQHVVSRAHHPQTLGKIEAFWKHLKNEFLERVVSGSINDMRERLRLWIESHYNFQRPHQGIEGAAPADRYFKMADQVREVIEKGVAENAERMALDKEPIKPFYMFGRVGRQDLVIRQQGGDLVMNLGDKELEKIQLKEDENEKPETGQDDRGGDGRDGQGEGPGSASGTLGGQDDRTDLPGDGPQADGLLQAGGPDGQGDADGSPGQLPERQEEQSPSGIGQPAQPKRRPEEGEPEDAVDAAPDPQALPERPETPPQGPQTRQEAGAPAKDESDEPGTETPTEGGDQPSE